MTWGAIGGAAVGVIGGALVNKGGSGNQSSTTTQTRDPRAEGILYGDGTNGGLLGKYQALGDKPQDTNLAAFGNQNLNYLGGAAGQNQQSIRDAGQGLLAPRGNGVPAYAAGNMVQAPSQNNLNLTGSFDSLVNGPAGANPFLTGAIQKGINQSSNAFGNYLDDTKKATQDTLSNIGSASVLAGQYGGSRQGIAQGKAIESMNTQLGRAASQFGQNNTDAAVAAQSGAYDADRNRQLSATMGLSGQQYGVAQQNAATKNQAEFMNVQNMFNQQGVNQQGQALGANMLNGQINQAYQFGGNQDNYDISKAGQVNGLLTPYLGTNGSTTTSPMYQNQGANLLGGASAGLGIWNGLQKTFGGNSAGNGSYGGGPANTYYDGYGYAPVGG